MEKNQAYEHTAVLLTSSKDCDSGINVGNRDGYGHVYEGDAISMYSRNSYKNKCQLTKYGRWLNFGLLCLLVGGIAGYCLRAYTNTKFEKDLVTNLQKTAELMDSNPLPNTPERLVQYSDHVPERFNQTKVNHVTNVEPNTRVSEASAEKRATLINSAIGEILENMTGIRGISDLQMQKVINLTKDPSQSVYLSVGMRNDYLLQACGEKQLKQSFPDVDYALFGYDILKGFPLSVGHDPGFTLPIFLADYSSGTQSADCRYSIPKGLAIVPDVSCVTSFSSEIIKTKEAFSKSLSVNAGIQASGWGASFSMSGGYSKAKSEFEQKERVYILSSAECEYYFSKIVISSAPEFNQDFLKWVRRLEQAYDKASYIEFFSTFGTHFPTETTFGARYTYEHSMTQTELQTKEKAGMNVAMAASYSGLFSIGASFGLNADQKQEAKSFSKDVTTRTFSVGAAPPADGDAMKWASSVQSNPVPVSYKLSSIENLFTENFMKDLNIDYDHIRRYVLKYKHEYKDDLLRRTQLDQCPETQQHDYYVLSETRLMHQLDYSKEALTLCECANKCLNLTEAKCIAISLKSHICQLYAGEGNDEHLLGTYARGWNTMLMPQNAAKASTMLDTKINGKAFDEKADVTVEQCEGLCASHGDCFAMTYSTSSCMLYKKNAIMNVIRESGSKTAFYHYNM